MKLPLSHNDYYHAVKSKYCLLFKILSKINIITHTKYVGQWLAHSKWPIHSKITGINK